MSHCERFNRWGRQESANRQHSQFSWMRPESQSLPSPFQQTSAVEHHARAVAAVAEAQRQEDLLEHAVSFHFLYQNHKHAYMA